MRKITQDGAKNEEKYVLTGNGVNEEEEEVE